jgi:hypothetical protein
MVEPRPRKLLDQVRDAIRVKHYSYSTEKTYVHWIRRFILFHNKCHPAEMATAEVTQFLTSGVTQLSLETLALSCRVHPAIRRWCVGCVPLSTYVLSLPQFLKCVTPVTYLAIAEHVTAAAQNQALNAIVFLYRVVVQQELVGSDAVRAK